MKRIFETHLMIGFNPPFTFAANTHIKLNQLLMLGHYRNFQTSLDRTNGADDASGLQASKYLTIPTCGQKPQTRTNKRPERDTFSSVRGIVLRQRRRNTREGTKIICDR